MNHFLCLFFSAYSSLLIAKPIVLPNRAQSTLTPVESYTVPHPEPVIQDRQVDIPGFLETKEVTPLCILTQGTEEEAIIATGVRFACIRQKPLQKDHLYSVIRKDTTFEDKSDTRQSLYWIVSKVRILSTDDTSTGQVEKEVLPTESGDWVVEERSITRKFQPRPLLSKTGSHHATVVAFSSTGQSYGVQDDFVFLDQGRKAGLDVDAVLPIHRAPDPKIEAPIPSTTIGTIQILEATDTSAIGYLLKTTKEIPLGAVALF